SRRTSPDFPVASKDASRDAGRRSGANRAGMVADMHSRSRGGKGRRAGGSRTRSHEERDGAPDARLLSRGGCRGPPFLALSREPLRVCCAASLVHARAFCMNVPASPPYIEFGTRSNFSFLRGASRPEELV